MKISVCMIVKNEENVLARCLDCVKQSRHHEHAWGRMLGWLSLTYMNVSKVNENNGR